MAAQPAAEYEEFVSQILRPTNISSLKGSYEMIKILVFTDSSDIPTDEIEIDDLYPFHTIADLSHRIYIAKELQEEYHPQNQCLLKPSGQSYSHFRYILGDYNYDIRNPFTLIQGNPDGRFVDLAGDSKQVKIVSRNDMLLERTLFTSKNTDVYVLHLFLYRDVLASYPGLRPINRTDWEGKMTVLFPNYPKEYEDGSIAADLADSTTQAVIQFNERLMVIQKLEELLQDKPLRKPGETTRGDAVNLSSVRNLRFDWKPLAIESSRYQSFNIERVFYDMPVSSMVPYIRYYPKTNTPLTKIHVEGVLNIPTLEKPEILLQWTQERSLTPDEDLIVAKILLRPGSGSVNPLYGTLFIFERRSAKFIVQPSADVKGLSPNADLYDLSMILTRALATVPPLVPKASGAPPQPLFTPANVHLSDAYIVVSLWLDRDDPYAITKKSLDKVLPFFRPFFQVTASPIKEQNPIAFLRYKCVNDFRTPSRDFQFLHRIIDLQKLAGKTSIPSLVKYYKEEFSVSDAIAEQRVSSFLENMTEFSMVDPETLEFTQSENPGIDIAIFGKHPYYTFHIYRVDSIDTLRRIKTLLSLLVSVEPEEFKDVIQSAKAMVVDDSIEQEAAGTGLELDSGEGEGGEDALVTAEALSRVAETTGNEDAAFELDDLGDFAGFGEEESAPAEVASTIGQGQAQSVVAAPTQTLKQLAESDEMPAVTVGQAGEAAEEDDEDELITDPSVLKLQPSRTYFRKRLQFYDRKLFVYKSTHKSQKKYPSACAGNALKQPAVMSEDEYSRMKDLYKEDELAGKVEWVEYPIKRDALPKASVKKEKGVVTERVTVLRYGSNLLPGQSNIYTCSLYWCRQDEIVILKSDFEGTLDRKSKPKDKNTCPFCRQGPVKNRKVYVKGESVIERVAKDKSTEGKSHLFVQFLTKNPHPEGLFLPCCFLKEKLITEKDHPAFASLPTAAQKLVPSEPSRTLKEEDMKPMIANYEVRLKDFTKSYITGAEKLPLEFTSDHGPQIGIVPEAVDTFFAQKTVPDLVKHDHTVWKLMTDNRTNLPNVSGFFRIAVENRKRFEADSFFAAVAPYLGLTGTYDIRAKLVSIITPRVFIALNYGNFLFEFYDPSVPTPTMNELNQFIKTLGGASSPGLQKESITRLWKSYFSFKLFLEDRRTLKEFRQFYNIFTIPGLIPWTDTTGIVRTNGILFIVIEIRKGVANVRCPPYGVSPAMLTCDVAFIIHYIDDRIWEPLFYTRNDPSRNLHETTMVFTRDTRADWPSIVEKRVVEFETMCKSSGLGMYTDSPLVNPSTLIPLSKAMILRPVTAILRDTYNHVSAVLYSVNDQLIYLPVIDDGHVYPDVRVELDWRNFMRKLLAPADVVKNFYDELLPSLSPSIAPTYKIMTLVKLDKSIPDRNDMYAFHLQGGLFVPVKKSEVLEMEEVLESASELPWMIDTKLVFGEESGTRLELDYKDFEEIYQHLRYTFANWLATVGGSLRTEINEILFDRNGNINMNIPLSEKRLRLFIKIGNIILGWLDSSIPQIDRKPTLKRVDCRVIVNKEGCSNKCVWKDETKKCLLHVPEKFNVGVTEVDAKGLFIKKLIEELIRFPEKRAELMSRRVREYVKLRAPFRSGNEYIVPEDSVGWTELLRMEWRDKKVEKPKFIEEFSWYEQSQMASPEEEVVVPAAASSEAPLEEEEAAPLEEVPAPDEEVPAPDEEAAAAREEEAAPEEAEEAEEAEEVEEPIPATSIPVLASYLGNTAKNIVFLPGKYGSIHSLLHDLGIDIAILEEKGQILEYPVLLDMDVAKYVAKQLHMSIYQLAYEADNDVPPTPLIVRVVTPSKQKLPFLCIIQTPDGQVGVLSRHSTFEPIGFNDLPENMRKNINTSKNAASVWA